VSVPLKTMPAGSAPRPSPLKQTIAVGTNPSAVSVGDLNGDGRLDLALAKPAENMVEVLLNETLAQEASKKSDDVSCPAVLILTP
jgi:hypothetical protein